MEDSENAEDLVEPALNLLLQVIETVFQCYKSIINSGESLLKWLRLIFFHLNFSRDGTHFVIIGSRYGAF